MEWKSERKDEKMEEKSGREDENVLSRLERKIQLP